MPGIELLRTRTLAWTRDELILASRADGRVLARWPAPMLVQDDADTDDEGESDDEGEIEDAALGWVSLPNPERIAIHLGVVGTGRDPMVFASELAFVDPTSGEIERRITVFNETHEACGWSPDGTRLFASGMGRYVKPAVPPGDPADALLAAIEAPAHIPLVAQPGLFAIDAATGAIVGELTFDALPHCDRLVFRPDGRVALSRSRSQYQAHVARIDFEGTRVPLEGDPSAARIDGVAMRVGFAAGVETWSVRPLPGWREAVVVESGYIGPRVVAIWNIETGERGRVVFEIPEKELIDAPSISDRYPSILDAWPAGDHIVIARGNGEVRMCAPGAPDRILPLTAKRREHIAVERGTVYTVRGERVDAMRVDGETTAVVAIADAPIDAIAVDSAAGELIALLRDGSLRAFRVAKS